MFSSLVDVADSGLEQKGRLGVLNALSLYRGEKARDGETPVGEHEIRIAHSTIGLHARLGERQVGRVLKDLTGGTGKPVIIERVKRGSFHSASIYRFADDRFLRVATAVRLARRAVRAGLTKRVMAMDLMGREASAANCLAMVEACIWACEREDQTSVVGTLKALAETPFEDVFLTEGNRTLCRVRTGGVTGHFEHPNRTFRAVPPTPPYKDNPPRGPEAHAHTCEGVHMREAGKTDIADPEISDVFDGAPQPGDVAISALAREVGAPGDMVARLREATWRRAGDQLMIVTAAPWVRDQLLGMRQTPLVRVARALGCDGIEIVLEAKR